MTMHPDRNHIIGLDRRKSALQSSDPMSLPQRDKRMHPSNSRCANIFAASVAMTVTKGGNGFDAQHGKSGHKNKRTRFSTYSRSGALLYPHLAIIFIIAAHRLPSVVRAQAQNDTSTNVAVSNTLETIIPTVSAAPLPSPGATNSSITTLPPTPNPTTTPTSFPTATPSISISPSDSPTGRPTPSPTMSPAPTRTPSSQPTMQPSLSIPITKETKFRQEFFVGNGREFNAEDQFVFETLYQRYTTEYSPLPPSEVALKIETKCSLDKQIFLLGEGERMLKLTSASNATNLRGRYLQDTSNPSTGQLLTLDYTMKYISQHYNVTTYPKLFQNWTNSNLNVVLDQMQSLKLNVTEIGAAKRIIVSTQAPTASSAPSTEPTASPSVSFLPSMEILNEPTVQPAEIPTGPDPSEPASNNSMIYITVSLVLAISILAIGIFFYYKKRRGNQPNDFRSTGSKRRGSQEGSQFHSGMGWSSSNPRAIPNPSYGTSETKAYGSSFGRPSDLPSRLGDGASSPPGSLVSSQSLISKGNSMGGDSREESDAANELMDEFDQYKDQNLEKMRAEIEDLPECNGMMSQAVAKALIDQHDEAVISSSIWGGDDDISPPEIEASALGFVFDWLKRNGKVSDREK